MQSYAIMLFFLQSFIGYATLFVLVASASAFLPSYDPAVEFPFFEQCDLHPSPVECNAPVGIPMSCNGVFFCCPEVTSEIRQIVCDGQRFVGVSSTQDLRSITLTVEDNAFSEDKEEEDATSASSSSLSVGLSTGITATFAASTVLFNIF